MGLALRRTLPGGAEIALWHITESEDELLDAVSARMDAEEENYVRSVRNRALRKERLSVIALIDALSPGECHLRHLGDGKPLLTGGAAHISITHTTDYAAVLLSPRHEAGVDIEAAGRDFRAVERKAMSEAEISWLPDPEDRLPESPADGGRDGGRGLRNLQCGIVWCAKEAVYKTVGRKVYDYASTIEIRPFSPAEAGSLTAGIRTADGERMEMGLRYSVVFGHILVWTLT